MLSAHLKVIGPRIDFDVVGTWKRKWFFMIFFLITGRIGENFFEGLIQNFICFLSLESLFESTFG